MDRYEEAKRIVFYTENFNIDFLQRKLSVSYSEAAEYLSKMDEDGFIDIQNQCFLLELDYNHFKEWIGIDLDGTLAYYDEWRGVEYIGEPIKPMLNFVNNLLDDGKKVKIFTARATDSKSIPYIREWLNKNNLPELEITNVKDLGMIMLYDDRCRQVVCNSGEIIKK